MATYHGIERLECLSCGFITHDEETMELINDGEEPCKCGSSFWHWSMVDGERAVTSGNNLPNGGFCRSRGHYRLQDGVK
jgi:hypothetical protein